MRNAFSRLRVGGRKPRWVLAIALALVAGSGTASLAVGQGPFALTGTEGTVVSGTVATVDEGCSGRGEPDCPPRNPVQIAWGDGLTGTGTVVGQSLDTAGAAVDTVAGAHVFTTAGVYTATVQHDFGTATGVISIADASLTATPISAQALTAGQAFSGTVATFTDADPDANVSLYTATVNWGDETAASSATITTATGGGFTVSASHTYADAGDFTATVTIDDKGGATAAATDGFTITAPVTTSTVTQTTTTTATTTTATTPANPVAAFSWNGPVLANVPVTFDPSGSTGSGLTYSWTFCGPPSAPVTTPPASNPIGITVKHSSRIRARARRPRDRRLTRTRGRRGRTTRRGRVIPGPIAVSNYYCGYVSPPTSSVENAQFSFPYATVHDAKYFPQGVDPTRRRETYPVTLTVTDGAGQQSSVTHEVTVLPDTPLSANFGLTPDTLAPTGLVTITPEAIDNDAPTGQITEEDWYLGATNGQAVLVCTPGSCKPGPGRSRRSGRCVGGGAGTPVHRRRPVRSATGPRRHRADLDADRRDQVPALMSAGRVPGFPVRLHQAGAPAGRPRPVVGDPGVPGVRPEHARRRRLPGKRRGGGVIPARVRLPGTAGHADRLPGRGRGLQPDPTGDQRHRQGQRGSDGHRHAAAQLLRRAEAELRLQLHPADAVARVDVGRDVLDHELHDPELRPQPGIDGNPVRNELLRAPGRHPQGPDVRLGRGIATPRSLPSPRASATSSRNRARRTTRRGSLARSLRPSRPSRHPASRRCPGSSC